MIWARIYSALKAIAALSGLVAFAGFAYAFYKDVRLKENVVSQGWQEAEIYRVVLESRVDGLTFEEIVNKVQMAYFTSGHISDVNLNIAQRDAVRRGLIGLAAKNSIIVDTSGRYIVPTVPKNYLTQDILFSRMQTYNEAAFKLVMENPGRFDNRELRSRIAAMGATDREAWQVVGGAIFMNPPAFVPVDSSPYSTDSKLKVLE